MNEFFKIDKRITDASDNALKLCKKQFEYIDENKNVLDVGCACGDFGVILKKYKK